MDWKMTLLNERMKGREEGRLEGREEGRLEGVFLTKIELVTKKVQKGVDLSEIAEFFDTDEDSIRPVWEAVKAAAPDYDQEQILRALLGR